MNDHKIMAFRERARVRLFKGVQRLNDAVTTTLSPKGRNVAIQRQWGSPIVVHDGVTVAREVQAVDELENMGVNLVKHAAQKTNDEAGDGTTTATLFAYEIVKRGMKLIEEGVNPMIIRNQVYAVLPDLLKELERISKKLKGQKDIERVATISSADPEIGRLIAEAVEKVGKDGKVTVEEGKTFQHEVEYTDGMLIDRGYISPWFITNEMRMESVLENPVVAIVNMKISLPREIIPILESLASVSKEILIICEDLTGDALATLIHNKAKGNITAAAIKTPPTTDKEFILGDIAVLTGGKVLDNKTQINVQTDKSWIGQAKKIIVGREESVIIGGKGDPKLIEDRIKAVRENVKNEKSTFEKEKLENRLARLTAGIAVVKVGGKTEVDIREKVERVKDAIGAASSAREEGIVPGGGVAFLKIRKVLKNRTEGEKLLYEVLESPIRKIMQNCGENADKITNTILQLESDESNLGYEVMSGEIKDMYEAGIIDPAKVLRLSLENAVGVATSILTTDCLIAIKSEEDRK